MSKERELIKELIEVLGHVRVDNEMALSGDWNKSDDGFECEQALVDAVLVKAEEYDKNLFDEAMKESRKYMEEMTKEEEEDDE